MQVTRTELALLPLSAARDPAIDPVYGDLVQGVDGERRRVEIGDRQHRERVCYRRAGADVAASEGLLLCECDIAEWRRWASGAEILHAAHKPIDPPSRRLHRRGRLEIPSRPKRPQPA